MPCNAFKHSGTLSPTPLKAHWSLLLSFLKPSETNFMPPWNSINRPIMPCYSTELLLKNRGTPLNPHPASCHKHLQNHLEIQWNYPKCLETPWNSSKPSSDGAVVFVQRDEKSCFLYSALARCWRLWTTTRVWKVKRGFQGVKKGSCGFLGVSVAFQESFKDLERNIKAF